MDRSCLGLSFAFILLLGLCEVSSAQTKPDCPETTAANSDFALDLYKQLAAEHPGKNLFFSPFSLSSALMMAAEGAQGETALEMGQALRLPASLRNVGADATEMPWRMQVMHAGMGTLTDRFNRAREKQANLLATVANRVLPPKRGYELHVANALWLDKQTRLRKEYLDTVTKHYGGGVYGVDFRGNVDDARRQINAWAERQTRCRIKDAFEGGDKLTRLVLTNAIYFKGEWEEKFEPRNTKDEDFHLSSTSKVPVPRMWQQLGSGRYGAFEGDGTQFATPHFQGQKQATYPDERGFAVVEIPYKGDNLSMVLIAPRAIDGLARIERVLMTGGLPATLDQLEKRAVYLEVPKFELKTGYDLKRPLAALGMKRAFDYRMAQFEGMTGPVASQDRLHMASVSQKAFVEVNEQGTEAAAVSTVEMGLARAAAPVAVPFIPTFSADRPFLFLIRDRKTNTILFIGRIVDPRAKG